MKSSEIRRVFLDFFREKDHLVLPSFPLVPQNDPTLLLVGAGMAPLKPYFTGEKTPPHARVATCQKCVRTPDIEKVGITARHATFFEMLGNFSFGDYFKEDAIPWSWELMTKAYGLPPERLYVSIYLEDEEAFSIWKDKVGVPVEKIYRLGKEDNFWEIGTGPCGPCSEIYYDLGPQYGCGKADCQVGCDCDRYLEVWNLVFTQFEKDAEGNYTPLEQKNIDTGAGLERLAIVMQGVSSFFEIDIVRPLVEYFAAQAGIDYGKDPKKDISLRVITEHLRGLSFLIADGVLPSNEGRGYVLRRILRRAVRHGKLLEIEPPFLFFAVPLLVEMMQDPYTELKEKEELIKKIIRLEEERFNETLEQGMVLLEEQLAALQKDGKSILPGKIAFKLYDTFGFPVDLTREILEEKNFQMDDEGFEKFLEDQRERGRAAHGSRSQGRDNLFTLVKGFSTRFVGYEALESEGEVIGILSPSRKELVSEAKAGEEESCYLLLDQSPFYAERGGQVGDTGIINFPEGSGRVTNTVTGSSGEEILHLVEIEKGMIRQGEKVVAVVDKERRKEIARNHTATHLLHRTLKTMLGSHVNQAGSFVAPDRLRFDFTHFAQPDEEELNRIEDAVNNVILNNMDVITLITDLEQAARMGAEALFEEKYADKVRVIEIGDYSLELCGGTHVNSTGELGICKIIDESGIGSGMRRIEALTGRQAYRFVEEQELKLKEIASVMKVSREQAASKVREMMESQKELQRKVKQLQQQVAQQQAESLLQKTEHTAGVPVLSTQVEVENMEILREYLDKLKEKMESGIIMLGTLSNGKVIFAAAVTRDLVEKGFHAGNLIGEVAKLTGGGGGGRPDMAQAGGKDPDKLPYALSMVPALVKAQHEKINN